MPRNDGRAPDELRSVKITPGFLSYPEGSVLIETGQTRVICAATALEEVPLHLQGKDSGWITAEYAMLPRSTHGRTPRESRTTAVKGRTYEIQRLIGRSLRAAVDLTLMPGWTFIIDCDVIQADGGTRTASITGGYVALRLALDDLIRRGIFDALPVLSPVAAASVGVVNGIHLLDLDYSEDSRAELDLNVAANSRGKFIEVQGTAEGQPFDQQQLDSLLQMAGKGLRELFATQRRALEAAGVSLTEAD